MRDPGITGRLVSAAHNPALLAERRRR